MLDPFPAFLGRSSQDSEDFPNLVELVLTAEQWSFGCQLGKDAANRPDVDRGSVLIHLKKQLGCSVVQGYDIFGVRLDGD